MAQFDSNGSWHAKNPNRKIGGCLTRGIQKALTPEQEAANRRRESRERFPRKPELGGNRRRVNAWTCPDDNAPADS